MKRLLLGAWPALCLLSCANGCIPIPGPGDGDDVIILSFDFRDGTDLGFEAGISDYSAEQIGNLQFESGIRDLPENIGINDTGFYIQSNNTPDDLFTFIKRQLGPEDGIVPGAPYLVSYDIYLVSNAPSGCAGIGGAPGESVYLKAGASPIEPQAVGQDGDFRLNVDKGDQANSGTAASLTGTPEVPITQTIANGVPCDLIPNLDEAPYVLILRAHEHDVPVIAAADGTLWLLVGVESGFEGLTGVYYQRIDVRLDPVD